MRLAYGAISAIALTVLMAGGPAAAGQDIKLSIRIVKPSKNQHYAKGPVKVSMGWLPGVVFDNDNPTVTVQVNRTSPDSATKNYTAPITYAGSGAEVDITSFASPNGSYKVRARSNSPHYPEWTEWRPFNTSFPITTMPTTVDRITAPELKKRYPKPTPGPPIRRE